VNVSRVILVVAMCAVLGACAMGKSKFQCPVPNGVSCKSVKEMYVVTDAAGEQGLEDARNALQGREREKHKHRGDSPEISTSEGHTVSILDPGDPLPLRVPPRVLRVLITPWEDANGDLHAGGYVFTEIESRRWSMASAPAKSARSAFPLQVEIAGMERATGRTHAVPGANTATPGRESTATSNAKPSERSSGGGGS
jgi:conjugal transfer pilus assembly protein TraV